MGQTQIHLNEVTGLGSFFGLEVVLNEGQAVGNGHRIAGEKRLERAATEYGDLRVGEHTIKEVAGGELLRLRTISVGKVAPEIDGVAIGNGEPWCKCDRDCGQKRFSGAAEVARRAI